MHYAKSWLHHISWRDRIYVASGTYLNGAISNTDTSAPVKKEVTLEVKHTRKEQDNDKENNRQVELLLKPQSIAFIDQA